MHIKNVKRIVVLILLIFCLPFADRALGDGYNRLLDVRLKVYKGYSRITLYLERGTSYKLVHDLQNKTLIVKIPRCLLRVGNPVLGLKNDIVEGVVFSKGSSQFVRAEIKLRLSRVEFTHFLYRNPPGVVINIREDKKSIAERSSSKKGLKTVKRESRVEKKKEKKTSKGKEKDTFKEDKKLLSTTKSEYKSGLDASEEKSPPPIKEEKKGSKEKEGQDISSKESVPVEHGDQEKAKPLGSQEPAIKDHKQTDLDTKPVVESKQDDEEIFQSGFRLFHEDKYADALEKLASLVEGFPQSKYAENAMFLIGDCYFNIAQRDKSKRYNTAISAYKSALRSYPDSGKAPRAAFRLGESYQRMNVLHEAEASFRALLNKYPKSEYAPQSQLRMADSIYKNNKFREALKEFKRFVTQYPDSEMRKVAEFGIADVYYKVGNFKSAQEHYQIAMEKWPEYRKTHLETLFNIGDSYFQNKEYEKSREAFLRFVNLFPKSDFRNRALNRIGDSLRAQGKTEEALRFYSLAISQYPQGKESGKTKLTMADIGIKEPGLSIPLFIFDYNPYTMPLKTYREISKLFEDSELGNTALLREGLFYLNHGRDGEAVSAFKRLLLSSSNDFLCRTARVHMHDTFIKIIDKYYKENNFLLVIENYLKNFYPFLKDVADSKTLFRVGESYQRLGLYKEAVETYKKAQKADKNRRYEDFTTLKMGEIYLLKDDYENAERIFGRFVDRFPKSEYRIDALHYLGDTFYRKGDFQKALDGYISALRGDKKHSRQPLTYYFLANSQEKLGNSSKAIDAYRKVIGSFKIDGEERKDLEDFVLESYIKIGDSLYDNHRYLEALNAYNDVKKLTKKNERSLWVSFQTANCYRKLVKEKDAIETLKWLVDNSDNEFWKEVAAYTIDDINWEAKYKDRL